MASSGVGAGREFERQDGTDGPGIWRGEGKGGKIEARDKRPKA